MSKPKKPKEDPAVAAERKRAEEERKAEELRQKENESAMTRGWRGRRSLLGGGYLGFVGGGAATYGEAANLPNKPAGTATGGTKSTTTTAAKSALMARRRATDARGNANRK